MTKTKDGNKMVAKRYVRELASDFRKWYKEKCKEHPEILPAGFLREANAIVKLCERGNYTSREACSELLENWRKCEDWIWVKSMRKESAIKL